MPTVQRTRVPRQQSRPAKPAHLAGDAHAVSAALREAAERGGDALLAIMMIEAIHETPKLSAAKRQELTLVVLSATSLVRGWDAPLAVDEQDRQAGLPIVDGPDEIAPAEASSSVDEGVPATELPEANPEDERPAEPADGERTDGPADELVDQLDAAAVEGPPGLEAIERGDVAVLTARLQAAAAAQPKGDCVEAIVLIQVIHDQRVSPAETLRRTRAVLDAVAAVRWAG
ncbi:hypothetical protein HH310_12365 [Actinoplanes sp. TBRC 11911]|uniref:hypothetical protein n=1 Tax=Actinoplanes sp. TBRC 11911 TaxID=2729386 RepID=UPI00145E593B|nr:hypothetical protein [Actinoplanes sp. TBRC 11911]NMO51987.1 hypothetical protein [Actinoplanes sp. TBRC 11911]